MKRVHVTLIAVAILVATVVNVYATALGNDEPSSRPSAPGSLRAQLNDGTLSVSDTLPVMAALEVNLGGQTHLLQVPAVLSIDAQAALADADFLGGREQRIGILHWEIESMEEYDSEYAISQFTSVNTSSPGNKLVVVYSRATNLGREPFKFIGGLREEFAYDEVGNRYDSLRRSCEDINPGATQTCRLIFDVPANVQLVGLDLAVVDYRRIPIPVGE